MGPPADMTAPWTGRPSGRGGGPWLRDAHGVPQDSRWVIADEAGLRFRLRFTAAPDSALLTPGGPGQSTHEVSLTGADEVDGEVEALPPAAYERNA